MLAFSMLSPKMTLFDMQVFRVGFVFFKTLIALLSSSSFYWASVVNAPNVLQPYWLIVLPLDVPDLTASLLL